MFVKLSRAEGKGSALINFDSVVAIFASQTKTIVRTTAGGDNTSFVVTENTDEAARKLAEAGARFVSLTRRRGGAKAYFNLGQVVGIFQRGDETVVRTTGSGEHADYVICETVATAESLVSAALGPRKPAAKSTIKELLIRLPGWQRRARI